MNAEASSLQDRFEKFLERHELVTRGTGTLVAVSGGVDSMVLLDLFRRIAPSWKLSLSIVHVNHGLRGRESDDDEAFVRTTAASASLPFFSTRLDIARYQETHGVSKQEAGRALRYQFFETVRRETGAACVATAHHADDNAETVLMNALRGAGVRGLSGIPIRREPAVIRPLLFAFRSEIEAHGRTYGIPYREDSSNTSRAYTRNHLRLDVLPTLSSDLNTDAARSLNRLSATMRSLASLIASEAERIAPSVVRSTSDGVSIAVDGLRSQPRFLQEELMLSVLRGLAVEPTQHKVEAMLALCDQPTGRSLDLSGTFALLRNRDTLVTFRRDVREFRRTIEVGPRYDFPGFRFSVRPLPSVPSRFDHPPGMEFADADRLGEHLVLRSWTDGDWFIPLGMDHRKKLSDFFVNARVSRPEKRSIPILESDGAIVWVCGLRLDHRFRISSSTRHAVQLTYETRNLPNTA